MRKLLIILCAIIGVTCLIFIADNYIRSEYEDPFRVSKAFSYSYMTRDATHMKTWGDKEIHKQIDQLQYSTHVNDTYANFWESFQLVSFRRVGSTIVSTYAYNAFEDQPLFYSVVMKPNGSPSLWERVKDFIYFDLPFGDKMVGFPHNKKRWLVADFFTNDDFEEYVSEWIERIEKRDINWLHNRLKIDKQLLTEIEQRQNYEDKWSATEKIRQNEEIKKLYRDYKGLRNNDNEESP